MGDGVQLGRRRRGGGAEERRGEGAGRRWRRAEEGARVAGRRGFLRFFVPHRVYLFLIFVAPNVSTEAPHQPTQIPDRPCIASLNLHH
uniref:Uncharacterized protein n=1 Tax=Oryza meridionalis TaxID=40149 RepID=A0A0E0DEM4_9ORYZ